MLTPSMRKSVSVKNSFRSDPDFAGAGRLCRHPPHPHSLVSDFSLGASWAFSFQSVLPPDYRPRLRLSNGGVGPGRSHRNSAVVTRQFSIPGLRRCGQHALIEERLVRLPAYPHSMQQDGPLPRHRHHRSFLRIINRRRRSSIATGRKVLLLEVATNPSCKGRPERWDALFLHTIALACADEQSDKVMLERSTTAIYLPAP